MPIHADADVRHLNQQEFGKIAYQVIEHVFVVHQQMGRFFHEDIYRDAVALRLGNVSQTEVRIDVIFEDFCKEYYIDLLVEGGAVFELKAVANFVGAHRSQILNYLLLGELSHGKLVNFRSEEVEHEFVNTSLKRCDRTVFSVEDREWLDPGPIDRPLRPWMTAFLREIGAGLDVQLYRSAASHVFGGDETVLQEIEIISGAHHLGSQKVRLVAPGWALHVTTVRGNEMRTTEDNARRFLNHTNLKGIHWINITRRLVTFTTIRKHTKM